MRFAVVALCLLLALAGASAKKVQTFNGVTVDFIGDSGAMRVYRGSPVDKATEPGEHFTIQPLKLAEVGDSKSKSYTFAQMPAAAVWGDLVDYPNGYGAMTTFGPVTLDNGAKFSLTAIVTNTTVTINGTSVEANALKFNWTFACDTCNLTWAVTIKNKGGKHGDEPKEARPEMTHGGKLHHGHQMSVGPGVMLSPAIGVLNGETKDVIVTMEGGNKHSTMTWNFGHSSNVDYDPVVSLNASGSITIQASAFLVALLSFVAYIIKM